MTYIERITAMKDELIKKGFDYPTQDITTATEREIEEFYAEAISFLQAN